MSCLANLAVPTHVTTAHCHVGYLELLRCPRMTVLPMSKPELAGVVLAACQSTACPAPLPGLQLPLAPNPSAKLR